MSEERKRLSLGFASVREIITNLLGAGVLVYGITGADSDRALVVVAAGLALLGLPLAGSLFERKG